MNSNDNKKTKLSLTGSLASLAREVQNDTPITEKSDGEKKSASLTQKSGSQKKGSTWDEVLDVAFEFKNNPSKIATVYIYENIKKDIEALKRIDGLENVPLTALISAIIETFLNGNIEKIKDLLAKSSNRF